MFNGLKSKFRTASVAGLVLALSSGVAMAVPPDMTAIEFPISVTSMVSVIVAAGGVILLAYIGPKTAFRLIKSLAGALTRSVR